MQIIIFLVIVVYYQRVWDQQMTLRLKHNYEIQTK